jgi:hypothetical protein
MNIDFGDIIQSAANDAGVELGKAKADVTLYAQERAAHLQTIAGQPGFDEALRAEANAVIIFAANRAVDLADAQDAKVWGVIFGLLAAVAAA